MPAEVGATLMGARLTALAKLDGCGIVARSSKRMRTIPIRLVDEGWDSMLRAATDADHSATILSVDGIGAYDHVLRVAMLERLLRMPAARAILPFVRLAHTSPSRCCWWNDQGIRHNVTQRKGVDKVILSWPELCTGIRLHQGKTRVWNKAGTQPEDVDTLRENVWRSHGSWHAHWHEQFTRDKLHARAEEERRQSQECRVLQSASPRSNHTLRTLPPAMAVEIQVWRTRWRNLCREMRSQVKIV